MTVRQPGYTPLQRALLPQTVVEGAVPAGMPLTTTAFRDRFEYVQSTLLRPEAAFPASDPRSSYLETTFARLFGSTGYAPTRGEANSGEFPNPSDVKTVDDPTLRQIEEALIAANGQAVRLGALSVGNSWASGLAGNQDPNWMLRVLAAAFPDHLHVTVLSDPSGHSVVFTQKGDTVTKHGDARVSEELFEPEDSTDADGYLSPALTDLHAQIRRKSDHEGFAGGNYSVLRRGNMGTIFAHLQRQDPHTYYSMRPFEGEIRVIATLLTDSDRLFLRPLADPGLEAFFGIDIQPVATAFGARRDLFDMLFSGHATHRNRGRFGGYIRTVTEFSATAFAAN